MSTTDPTERSRDLETDDADADRRLDGNAAAGLLAEIFRVDLTVTPITCAGCGATNAGGAIILYAHGMGMILRCPGCGGAMLRIARSAGRYRLDLRGIHSLEVEPAAPAR